MTVRRLRLVLGDQLDPQAPALAGFDPALDRALMIEAAGEATHVWSHKARIALFLAAMRHYADALRGRGVPLTYVALDQPEPASLGDRLRAVLAEDQPEALVVAEPGEVRVLEDIRRACAAAGVALEIVPDRHFLVSREEFARWAAGKRELRMESFYRHLRRKTGVLMRDGEPDGGAWNYDAENRKGYGRGGPGEIPAPAAFAPDAITREVLALVERRFPDHPGRLDAFRWPVTREQGLDALARFVDARLAQFGPWQDAMWTDTPFGWHSLLSPALNLKLISPREVIEAALAAARERRLPIASVEGFVRQVLGWREFMRGVYWLDMPGLAEANHFGHRRALPAWYWSADTQMNCMRQAVGQTLALGYAHHIQRLMVTGIFGLLAEVEPRQVSDWYLAVYVDAVEWVELPNTAGMALYANGGRFTSKPYVASGAYVNRMSNYCQGCRYRPDRRTGADACPFTTLYWNFLDRHEDAFAANPRTSLMARNVARMDREERTAIRRQAETLLDRIDAA
ncbi:MAG TPA: cryptochrome/photolyase family protein [Pelomicrobium sp.]|nr:cryptochrome/photolyase family protein [Pelomicrobium sp.]